MTQDVSHELQDKFRVLQLLTRRHSPFFCKNEESGIREIVLCGPFSGLPSRNTSNKLWGGSLNLIHSSYGIRETTLNDVKAVRCQQISPHSPGSKIIGRIITSWRLWKRLHSYPQFKQLTLLQSEKNRIQPVRYNSFSNRQIVEQDARARDYFFSYQQYRAFLFLSQLFSIHLLLRVGWRVMSWVQLILSST